MQNKQFFNQTWCYCRNGVQSLTAKKFKAPKNRMLKPIGGLWFSMYTPEEEYVNAWQQFCFGERFNYMNVVTDIVTFKIKSSARVYVINNKSDFFSLHERFAYMSERAYADDWLDWEQISKVYDVVYVSREGISENYYNMYGWDFESGIVLNFDVIENAQHISLDPSRWVSVEEVDILAHPDEERLYSYSFKVNSDTYTGERLGRSAKSVYNGLVAEFKRLPSLASLSSFAVRNEILRALDISYMRNGERVQCEVDIF